MQLYEGTSQIQRLVIAKEVLLPRAVDDAPAPDAAAAASEQSQSDQAAATV
jgi:hypothetical protein